VVFWGSAWLKVTVTFPDPTDSGTVTAAEVNWRRGRVSLSVMVKVCTVDVPKVAFTGALKERETLEGLAKKYELQPTQISLWKTQAMRNFSNLFSKDNEKDKEEDVEIQQLYAQIGKLQVQNEFLKKKL
jgi:hypothetical protein